MDRICIEGGRELSGELAISGSKNAVLPLMVSALLTDEPVELQGTPRLADTYTLSALLKELGCSTQLFGTGPQEGLRLHAKDIMSIKASYELVSQMRASFWVIGPLLARCGAADVSLPGGCAIGTRPVDVYLKGLEMMGASIEVSDGYVKATTHNKKLQGTRFEMPMVSVGVTHVLMMAACLAQGRTDLFNAACEPEVVDVGECLKAMGAKIEGLGTRHLSIMGVDRLHGVTHHVSRDRIETGAYACAVAAVGGEVNLRGADKKLLGALYPLLEKAGAVFEDKENGLLIKGIADRAMATNVVTAPYPGFATDLQAPFMGLMCRAQGVSHIKETIFENRFMHVQELVRLGANISLESDTAIVTGVEKLKGAPVMATDLRASVTLVIAGLVAEGVTTISRVYHLDRGYERLEEKLSKCGAKIWREKTD